MDEFGEEVRERAQIVERALLLKGSFTFEGEGRDVGLHERGRDPAHADSARVGDRALGRARGGEEAGWAATALNLTASNAGRVGNDRGEHLADREIGPAGRSGRDLERNPRLRP